MPSSTTRSNVSCTRARRLGVGLATLDRRVVSAIATVKTEWGARLIPAGELERYLAERTEEPRGAATAANALWPQVNAPARCRRPNPTRAIAGNEPRRDRPPAER
jgi:hypothetical protein